LHLFDDNVTFSVDVTVCNTDIENFMEIVPGEPLRRGS